MFASSSGTVSVTPSVNGPATARFSGLVNLRSLSLRKCVPSRSAIAITLSAPTRSCSGTKYVFTDMPKPLHMLRLPFI